MTTKPYRVEVKPSGKNRWSCFVLMTFPGVHKRVLRDGRGKPREFTTTEQARIAGNAAILRHMNKFYDKTCSRDMSTSARKEAEELFQKEAV